MDLDDEELKVTRMMNGADRNSRVRVNNDIEVNEYVRTKDGVIGKVIKVLSNRVFLDNLGYAVLIRDIVKHCKQLIDLIEIGDILKIKISEEWVEKQDTIKFIVVGQTYTITEIKECLENGLFKIIQILTKEQFEANCYKVGGEDEC